MKILIIRRDNIGDLVFTTPLMRTLRHHYPLARIDLLVNSYSMGVVINNPDINNIYVYTKAKHRHKSETLFGIYLRRLQLLAHLRQQHYDYILLPNHGFAKRALNLARWLHAKKIIGFAPKNEHCSAINCPVELPSPQHKEHEIQTLFRLLKPLGIEGEPPAPYIKATHEARHKAYQVIQKNLGGAHRLIAIHISSRRPQQRWPVQNFIEFMQVLHQKWQCQFLLLWSPGKENNPLHPGDDDKAAKIVAATKNLPVCAYHTTELSAMIGGLSYCRAIVSSDGGAMHLGAGLGLPTLCFFGDSESIIWRPWGVEYQLLQPLSQNVADISVNDAIDAFHRLKEQASSLSDLKESAEK